MIEDIKKFLETQNLNWTGYILTAKNQDFRPATEDDFKYLDIVDFLISFGKQGHMAISIELDLIRFDILGETFDCGFDKYAGHNIENRRLCKARNLSQEWIDFQLKNNTLLYSAALRIACEKEKNIISKIFDDKEQQIERKIEDLNNKKAKLNNEKQQKIKEIEELEKRAEEACNAL